MRNLKKAQALVLVVVMGAQLLTGCGKAAEQNTTAETTETV